MADSSDSFQLVSVAEACRILNVSDSTIRRLLRAGRLEAEKVQRAQGHVWLVKVPAPTGTSSDDPPKQLGATDGHPPGPPALAAWMSSVLEPVIAELSVTRQQLVSQAETIGTLRAERDAAEARYAAILEAQSEPARSGLTHTVVAPPVAAGARGGRHRGGVVAGVAAVSGLVWFALGCAVIFLVILLVALLVMLPSMVIVEPPMGPEP